MLFARVISALILLQSPAPPQPAANLDRMAATERAFAAATKEIGVRDGFLTFFTEDAIDVAPVEGRLALIRIKDRLRAQPPAPVPPLRQLLWEPRWGAASSDGDLGWLTGPYVMRDAKGLESDRHGAYFSIWKRQADGTYKVRLDIGIATAAAVIFPDGFNAAPSPVAPGAAAGRALTADDIRLVEARFAEAAQKDVGAAYRAHMLPAARLHRNEREPFAGAEAAAGFMSRNFDRLAWAVLHAEAAASGDMAVTVGSYDAAGKPREGRPGTHERGFFVRVWHREANGAWKIAFETNGIR